MLLSAVCAVCGMRDVCGACFLCPRGQEKDYYSKVVLKYTINSIVAKQPPLAPLALPPNPYKNLPPERRNKKPDLRRYVFII